MEHYDSESVRQCSEEVERLIYRLAAQYHIPNAAMIGVLELSKARLIDHILSEEADA